jgi:hypothetical protein
MNYQVGAIMIFEPYPPITQNPRGPQILRQVSGKASHCAICNSDSSVHIYRYMPKTTRRKIDNNSAIALCDKCHKNGCKIIRLFRAQHGFIEWENIPKLMKSHFNWENNIR